MNQSLETAPAVDTRAPCDVCGQSMDGEHHNAKRHKACRDGETVTSKSRGPVKIKITSLPPPDSDEKVDYWLGTLPSCPIQNVTVGGITFPRYIGVPEIDKKGLPVDSPTHRVQWGSIQKLSDRQVRYIVDAIQAMVVRKVGDRGRGILLDRSRRESGIFYRTKDGDRRFMRDGDANNIPVGCEPDSERESRWVPEPNYTQSDADRPLAAFLYMVPASELGRNFRDSFPDPMLEE